MSVETIKLQPAFEGNVISFDTTEINTFVETNIFDTFNVYQEFFGVYTMMKLTKDLRYRIHNVSANPLIWQAHNNCAWDDSGVVRNNVTDIVPCRAKLNLTQCYDELFQSCFASFNDWSNGKNVELDANGMAHMEAVLNMIGKAAIRGARISTVAGQIYDYSTIEQYFKDETSEDIKKVFHKAVEPCQGWIELLKANAAAGNQHQNIPALFNAGSDFSGKKFTGNVFDKIDTIYDSMPSDAEEIANEGIVLATEEGIIPIWKATPSMFNAIVNQYRQNPPSFANPNPRVNVEEFTAPTGRMGKFYTLDGMPVVRVSETSPLDKYLTGATHGLWWTVAGTVGLGTSMSDITTLDNPGTALRIEKYMDNERLGKYSVLSHALFGTAVGNNDLIVGGCEFAVPE